ncbi:porphobilinogen deaminase (hydroxymethylbilane synthase) [Kyrpidia spormannii]|uniref:Porphobilinogen deaminase (Hydroxymethylbilane synthase) n=3 Tax=Kyrpidia spormannii TaxID=2055160 RepID=A0ACA8Z7M1_9BACL|nr:porphobilinogen deaminase (hydroxymethylbilane synthase) [Kyrpidia spormannii]CAB3391875.1 porphobilinogen deaminase (hydroxymethylbilane synthase) [Kyrpidia spormannii]
MTQTRWVIEQWQKRVPGLSAEVVPMTTRGDQVLHLPLSRVGGKGLFVEEIERALLEKRIDAAVHSLKDLPAQLAPGTVVGAVPRREDPRDAVITRDGRPFDDLPSGARVGTSSLRRVAQLRRYRPDLAFIPLRGNVDTRLRKLAAGEVDAVVLAAAGLVRLGLGDRITEYLSPEICLPAVGQGALAVQCREADEDTRRSLASVEDVAARRTVEAERTCLAALEGGCQVPIGALAEIRDGHIRLAAMVARPDGSELFRVVVQGEDPAEVGRRAAADLVELGAGRILQETREEAELGG